ncbi:recombination regulator RecX [Isoptericola sp. NEAU-Y5]|uniref:Regulatory protein RecX n=1 Tax=Isoptericola luteus TaxID=2879484 RepID=A0ABS7ZDS6_9MICO|nr:regulatory protein RecX [Isoptericola sp. NEAU-Y5]MCA5893189.1 recombination regulator RecX [Isoptericola sp. NEAU-Y5]
MTPDGPDEPGGRGEGKRRGRRPSVGERLEAGELTREEATELAREAVLRILTAAPKSRVELSRSLARKGYPDDVVAPVLDRFDEVGLVDDAAYADMVVRTRHAERGLARRAIAVELRRRGIDDETAADALEQVEPDDERAAADALARKLVGRTRGLDRDVRVRRAVAALGRKGYGPGVAFDVVRSALAGEDDGPDDELGDLPYALGDE